ENYYAVADVFVMPGRVTREFVEGFGLVFVEAGMRGKAVIGTKVGGITEAIRDGYSGLLIAPENVESLSEAIKKLLLCPETSSTLGKQGHEWTINNFSLDVMARHNDTLLLEIFWRKRGDNRSVNRISADAVEFSK
ncbi:MAG TPA: glycosyltransferase family 4 protein, partial [bacterium]|nr:glycosyltransferase family 4 protein [bacterium]